MCEHQASKDGEKSLGLLGELQFRLCAVIINQMFKLGISKADKQLLKDFTKILGGIDFSRIDASQNDYVSLIVYIHVCKS